MFRRCDQKAFVFDTHHKPLNGKILNDLPLEKDSIIV